MPIHKKKKLNLREALLDEMNRVRELISEHKALPNNVGMFGVILMQIEIGRAEDSIANDDLLKMLKAYENLKKITD